MERPPEADQRPVELPGLGVCVHKKEVLVVGKETQAGDQRHPKAKGNGKSGGRRRCAALGKSNGPRCDSASFPKRQHDGPAQSGHEENRGGFGEHHQGEEHADPDRGPDRAAEPRQADSQIQSCQGERGQHRLQNGQPAEAVEKRAGDQHGDREQRHPARPPGPQQQVAQQQIGKEESDGQPARGLNRDPGNPEQHPLQKRPHGNGGRGIEVARQMPVPEQVGANGGVSVPALIGVLRPVHKPRRMVGEIGAEIERVQDREPGDRQQPNSVKQASGGMGQWPSLRNEGLK